MDKDSAEKLNKTPDDFIIKKEKRSDDSYLIIQNNSFKINKFYEKSLRNENFNIEKKLDYDKVIKSLIFNKNYVNNINYNPKTSILQIDYLKDKEVGAENIGEFVYPLVQFIEQAKPDYILACDRGARIVGVAIHMLYRFLHGEFPTRDHAVHFRRISKTNTEEEAEQYLTPLVEKMLEETSSPYVFVLDDWVGAGVTRDRVKAIFDKLSKGKAQVTFGVLVGGKADISGSEDAKHFVDWHNNPFILGLDYDQQFDQEKGFKTRRTGNESAIAYRRRMSKHLKAFAMAKKLSVKNKAGEITKSELLKWTKELTF